MKITAAPNPRGTNNERPAPWYEYSFPAIRLPLRKLLCAIRPVAKQQGARSYELLAALSLAKLYQSTGRAAEACAILTPALDGFSPTAEMPEVNDAQALLEV
jgi:hypothetical protein